MELTDLVASLAALGRSMQGDFDPQRFLGGFSEQLQRLVPHDRVLIAYLEDEGRSFTIFAEHATRGPLLHEGRYTAAFDPGGRYRPGDLALETAFAGTPETVADLATDSRWAGPAGDRARAIGLHARMAVPLFIGGGVRGALLVGSFTPACYTPAHLEALIRVAELIAPFIENVVALHRERRRRERLAAAADLSPLLGTSLEVREVFERLADAARPIVDFDVMGVGVFARGRTMQLLRATRLDAPGPPMPPEIPLDEFSLALRLERGETMILRDASQELDTRFPYDRLIIERGARSGVTVPMWFGESVGGGLFFGKSRPYWYDATDVEVVRTIAGQVVLTIQHQRLAEAQQRVTTIEGRARHLERRVEALRGALDERYGFGTIVGRAPVFRTALERAAKAAPTETTVLITGESGTGKELVARAIHQASPRAEGTFVALNCAALPETLVESELFGHERGAFTGADRQKPGRFEQAAGGTLFLDEIAELSPGVQAKLLRVLQEREFQRVGGTASIPADVRLIAATNRDLAQRVRDGLFREDLYYRLAVFTVHLPPLRARGDDVLLLAQHFVRELGERMGKGEPGLARDARDLLLSHTWPGNIRELQNAIERALIVSDGGLVSAGQLGIAARTAAAPGPTPGDARAAETSVAPSSAAPPIHSPAIRPLADLERQSIVEALRHARGNKSRAAASLGLSRTQLYTRLRRLGLDH
jgi:two-component system response regulator HydG